jgi:uncharacterized membrane protein YebE (DUF533 family)
MSYFDGIELANLRFDAAVQAKCDPKKGWKRSGDKCVRNKLGQGGISGGAIAKTVGSLGLVAGAGVLTQKALKNRETRKELEASMTTQKRASKPVAPKLKKQGEGKTKGDRPPAERQKADLPRGKFEDMSKNEQTAYIKELRNSIRDVKRRVK